MVWNITPSVVSSILLLRSAWGSRGLLQTRNLTSFCASAPLATVCRLSCKVLIPTVMQWLYVRLASMLWCARTRLDGMGSSVRRMPPMLFVLLSVKVPEVLLLVRVFCVSPAFAHVNSSTLVRAIFAVSACSRHCE